VGFYQKLAESDEENAPKYTCIAGVGSVEDIRKQLLAVLR
jgi:hypothetical protein